MGQAEPRFDAGATRVDIGRGSVKALFVFLPLLVAACVACVAAVAGAADRATAIVGICFAGFFGLWLLLLLRALPRIVERRGLVFDARGVHFWRRSAWDLLPWPEIAAIGIGYDEPRRPPVRRLSKVLADQVLTAVGFEHRRNIAVEIFPQSPAALDRHPDLTRYRREQPPPREGLSALRWRVVLPPLAARADEIDQAVQALRPALRLGWFERGRATGTPRA